MTGDLPRRMIGANLPAEAYLTAGPTDRARVRPPYGPCDDKTLRLLLNGLRRWAQR